MQRLTLIFAAALGLLALAGIPTTAKASPTTTLDLNLGSVHTSRWARRELNQRNLGVGITHHFDREWAVSFGGYRNSYRRTSAYALAQWTPIHIGRTSDFHMDIGLAAGLASGYRKTEVSARPLAGGGLVRFAAPSGASIQIFIAPGSAPGFPGISSGKNGGKSKSGFIGFQASAPF